MNEYLSRGSQLDTLISIEPSDFLISKYDSELMTTPELKTYIDRQKQRGVANIIGFEIEYHRRFANTAAAFILTLIGMSLSSRKVKGGMGFNIAMGLLLSFSYILFDMVSSTFAISGATSPQIAVWIPHILYALSLSAFTSKPRNKYYINFFNKFVILYMNLYPPIQEI